MKFNITLVFSLCLFVITSSGQKRILTPDLIDTTNNSWTKIVKEKISNDGKYVLYISGSEIEGWFLNIKSLHNAYLKQIHGVINAMFTRDSKYVVYTQSDGLRLLNLRTRKSTHIENVGSFVTFQSSNHKQYVIYKTANSCVIRDMSTGREKKYYGNWDWTISFNGNVLLQSSDSLVLVQNGISKIIMHKNNAVHLVFDRSGRRLAFINEDTARQEKSICYYSLDTDSLIFKLGSNDLNLGSNLEISARRLTFSDDGEGLFFDLVERRIKPINRSPVQFEVWKYSDKYLPPLKRKLDEEDDYYTCFINKDDDKVIQLNFKGESVLDLNNSPGSYVIVKTNANFRSDKQNFWRREDGSVYFLVSTKNGSRKELFKNKSFSFIKLSPNGQYVLCFDNIKKNYYIYQTATEKEQSISENIRVPLFDEDHDYPSESNCYGISGWNEDNSSLYLNDKYDIWKVDLKGDARPINFTGGYGRTNKIVLRFLEQSRYPFKSLPINSNHNGLFTGFDTQTKKNGFFRLTSNGKIEVLGLHSYSFSFPAQESKAELANVYILRRMHTSNSPNIVWTKDFKKFNIVTDVQPQSKYNWLTAEIINWNTLDGKKGEGIIYKPENFDERNKYPVIFYVYEKLSQHLNNFLLPENGETINIPSYVSQGYIVITPNISYTVGTPGASALNYVVSCAEYVKNFSWIDPDKLGIQGHSWGGYEVNFIIGQTNLFAAACSAAGPTDLISGYGALNEQGAYSTQSYYEVGQTRIGATLWDNSQSFVDNSPIFYLKKIETPLLMVHNRNDGAVPWEQGVELFNGLRRLKKKVWMMQYFNSSHQLSYEDGKDFTIRMQQFFDHYLKDKPEPLWMSADPDNK